MLVPLTQSVYVAGELADTDHILLDIGTGYFVEVRCADLAERVLELSLSLTLKHALLLRLLFLLA